MSNNDFNINTRRITDSIMTFAFVLLLLHFYYYCFSAFRDWGMTAEIGNRILQRIAATGLFGNLYTSKLFALLLLAISLLDSRGRKTEGITYQGCVLIIVIGLFFYFGSTAVFRFVPSDDGNIASIALTYIALSSLGFLLVLSGGTRMSRVVPSPFRKKDPFGRRQTGFPQEQRRLTANFSINLPATYTIKEKLIRSWINIINPRRGILIMGSPGSGKSWFIIEPILQQLMAKGMSALIYDFKYDKLTGLAYDLFQQYKDRYAPNTKFYSINFTDIRRSHRCNILTPETMQWLSDAIDAARTILFSMNKTWINKQGEFFVESPVNFLAALIWFLRRYRDGIYCTLPHAIELAQTPYKNLFNILSADSEIKTLINPFVEAFSNNNIEMLDSQIASAKIPLGRLASPDLYYILTGNDCSLDINDPAAPKILCLGGDPARQEVLAPILSLYIDRINKLVNRPGKHPCALVCDEFATVRAYSMTTTIATARSNNIIPILAIQDLSQLRTLYSRDEADQILNITGNLFCGQVAGETARWISERFPRIWQDRTSISTNSSDTSINHSHQWEASITQATIANLSSGEFVGIIADDPHQPQDLKAFHALLSRETEPIPNSPLPILREVDATAIQDNFQQVKQDIINLVNTEVKKIFPGKKP